MIRCAARCVILVRDPPRGTGEAPGMPLIGTRAQGARYAVFASAIIAWVMWNIRP